MNTTYKKKNIVSVGRPANAPRLTEILHSLRIGESFSTTHPDAIRIGNSISRTTKKYGTRLSVTSLGETTVIEAVPYTA